MADTGWTMDEVGPGLWCAVAVPVLGLFGSLKALVSAPLVALVPVEQQPPDHGGGRSQGQPGPPAGVEV